MRTLLACLATAVLMLAGLAAVGFEPSNARADGPQTQRDRDSEILRELVAGCSESMGLATAKVQGGAFEFRCAPSLGVAPVKRGQR